jgi:hypothetical protein
MENETTQTTSNPNAGKSLGVAGLVLGIVAAIVSFIPCLGVYAIFPAIVGIVLSAISMSQASKAGASKSMAIAGLVCSIIGFSIAGWQYYQLKNAGDKFKDAIEKSGGLDSLTNAIKQLKDITDTTQTH